MKKRNTKNILQDVPIKISKFEASNIAVISPKKIQLAEFNSY